jgi:hypothetical protein
MFLATERTRSLPVKADGDVAGDADSRKMLRHTLLRSRDGQQLPQQVATFHRYSHTVPARAEIEPSNLGSLVNCCKSLFFLASGSLY